jgi:mRNA interferase MazF
MYMPSYSKNDIILVRYPFSDLSSSKVRPAVVVSAPHISQDIMITPLTSKIGSLLEGEFILAEWSAAGLNVATAIKRGLYTVHENLVVKKIGVLVEADVEQLDRSLRDWLDL